MVGGSGAAGESSYDAATGTHHGVGSPEADRRCADVVAQVDGGTGRARLWFALLLLVVLLAVGVLAIL